MAETKTEGVSVADLKFLTKRQSGKPANPYLPLMFLGGSVLCGYWAATQYVADRFSYQPNLGPALFRFAPSDANLALMVSLGCGVSAFAVLRSSKKRAFSPAFLMAAIGAYALSRGPVYAPFRVVNWSHAYKAVEMIRPVMDQAMLVGGATFLGAFVAATMAMQSMGTKEVSHAHGSAQWGSGNAFLPTKREAKEEKHRDALALNMEGPRRDAGFVSSALLIGRHANGQRMWYRGKSHILTMAPTRSGKGVGAVIPQLLTYRGSVVVTDVKGENMRVTYLQRLRMGQRVVVLDPFRVTNQGDFEHAYHSVYNPMDTIQVSGERAMYARDDAQLLASMLVPEGGKGENAHWVNEARSLLSGVMLHVCVEADAPEDLDNPPARTLTEVRRLLTQSADDFTEMLERMEQSPHVLVRRCAARLLQKDERERAGVVSTAQSTTDFLDSPPMSTVLEGESVDLAAVKNDPGISVFLVIPPEYLDTHAAWLRLMITSCIQALTRTQRPPKYRVLFLLDEFANLGRMPPVVKGISLVGGYGALFWIFVQDLAQLKTVYEKDYGTLMANTDVKQIFGTNDPDTAEMVSKMTGDATVFSESGSLSYGRNFGRKQGGGSNMNAGENTSEKARKLLNPDEVTQLPEDRQLLFIKGSSPLNTPKLCYWKDLEFEGKFEPNPMNA